MPIGPWLRQLPGPIWTMVLWCLLFSAGLAQATLANSDPRTALVLGGVCVEIAIVVLVLGKRAPLWVLQLCVCLMLAVTFVAAANAPNAVQMLSGATGAMGAVLYAGLWLPGASTYAYAAAGSVAYWITISVTGYRAELANSWVALTALLAGTAIVLHVVVSRITHQTTHDPLTGLMNRAGLDRYLSVHQTPGRATLPRTLVLLDLDGFKGVNDDNGHTVGDALLRDVAASLARTVRPDDAVFRFGGDEFLLVLPQTPLASFGPLLERIRSESPIRLSAGAVDWPADEPFVQAIAGADAAMYADKNRAQSQLRWS